MAARLLRSTARRSPRTTFSVPCFVRGYHVYQRIWSPTIGESLTTAREPDNIHDKHAVSVLDDTLCVVGHVPQEISRECFYFIKMGGAIAVEVTGKRERSTLAQGGLDVPCRLIFEHQDNKILEKAICLLEKKGYRQHTKKKSTKKKATRKRSK